MHSLGHKNLPTIIIFNNWQKLEQINCLAGITLDDVDNFCLSCKSNIRKGLTKKYQAFICWVLEKYRSFKCHYFEVKIKNRLNQKVPRSLSVATSKGIGAKNLLIYSVEKSLKSV